MNSGMSDNDIMNSVKAHWNSVSDSEWYKSLRTDERLARLKEQPESAFHPAVWELLRKYIPDLNGRRVLLPSSGDNHAAFAFALMGARVTSADISERQLENAAAAAERLGLGIEFVCDDTAALAHIPDNAFDLVYTSNGTLSWISGIADMYRNISRVLVPGGLSVMYDVHPFTRPFSCEPWKQPKVVKAYSDVFPDLHHRVMDIVNAQAAAGLTIREMAELPAADASFWYTYDELKNKAPGELSGINDPKKNPMAALPVWLTIISEKYAAA